MAVAGAYTLILSEDICREIEDVLTRKFAWSAAFIASTLEALSAIAEMVTPEFKLTDCIDPDDNRILEAGVAGGADCIVSGDKHLLRIKNFRGIEILAVDDFLKRLEAAMPAGY